MIKMGTAVDLHAIVSGGKIVSTSALSLGGLSEAGNGIYTIADSVNGAGIGGSAGGVLIAGPGSGIGEGIISEGDRVFSVRGGVDVGGGREGASRRSGGGFGASELEDFERRLKEGGKPEALLARTAKGEGFPDCRAGGGGWRGGEREFVGLYKDVMIDIH